MMKTEMAGSFKKEKNSQLGWFLLLRWQGARWFMIISTHCHNVCDLVMWARP